MHWKFTALLPAIAVSACAGLPSPAEDVPAKLRPGANESLAMVAAARGVQIYECRAAKDRTGAYEWAFVAPEAELFDASGRKIGTHSAGPLWESTDGSRIVGTVKEHADAPRADAIAWLLLATRSVGPQGSLSRITAVQRLHTAGGMSPGTGCSPSTVGTVARVPYTADYYFLTEKDGVFTQYGARPGVARPFAAY